MASAVGWVPQVSLIEGLTRTVAYYREHLAVYLEAPRPTRQDRP